MLNSANLKSILFTLLIYPYSNQNIHNMHVAFEIVHVECYIINTVHYGDNV